MPLGVSAFAFWSLTLAGSYSLVSICGRYSPERLRIAVGLEIDFRYPLFIVQ